MAIDNRCLGYGSCGGGEEIADYFDLKLAALDWVGDQREQARY